MEMASGSEIYLGNFGKNYYKHMIHLKTPRQAVMDFEIIDWSTSAAEPCSDSELASLVVVKDAYSNDWLDMDESDKLH